MNQLDNNPAKPSQAEIPNQTCAARNPHRRPSKTLTELETENSRLQRLVAELLIKNHQLRQLTTVRTIDSTEIVKLSS
jgi:hypothetical protein